MTKEGLLRINFRELPDNRTRLKCNFRCSYCLQIAGNVREYSFGEEQFAMTKCVWDMLSRVEDAIMVRINFNGEIFADGWATRCAFYIDRIPNVRICEFITNNSIDPKTYLDEIVPSKTTFNCSFHPEFVSIERFIENTLTLKGAGCDVFVNVCAIPQLVNKLPDMKETFDKHGIPFKLQGFLTLGGSYMGKKYPEQYTLAERRILKKTFYTKDEYSYFVRLRRTKGLDCYAGVDTINVFLDGSVKRCFTQDIGSVEGLVSGKVKLGEEPYPCHEKNCPCYAHFIGLKKFRKKYILSSRFVDNYEKTAGENGLKG